MTRAIFKRPVRIGGKFYECGAHDIDAALVDHWYLKALVADGLAQVIEDKKPEPAPAPAPAVETKVEPAPKAAPKVPVKPAAPGKKKHAGKK